MANHTLSTTADIDASTAMYAQQITGLRYGEDIPAGHPVRVGAGRKIFKAKLGDKFDGIVPRSGLAGQAGTIYGGHTRFRATDTDLDPEKLYTLTANYGEFADTAVTNALAVFRPVGRHDLEIIRVGATAGA